jgi:putative membrane-bound dehydrogenase-like protein
VVALGPRAARFAALLLALGATPVARQPGNPPYSPRDALNTFRLADENLQIELFASEPLISDPVAMEIDEDGRTYVVEMHGYPLDVGGSGRVILLDDRDGNGLPDRSTVFADGLKLPTGIMRWKKGVIVTDSPDVLYLEDTNGDGRADVRRVLLTGFALSNPQHTTNTPVYGLDNWIYVANEGPVRTIRYQNLFGDEGKPVHFPSLPNGPRLPPDADGRNVRFKPDTMQLEALSSRSQFGQTFDEWGHHFLNTNNRHIYHEVIGAPYLTRNPLLVVPSAIEQVPDYRQPAEVFPITRNPRFELLTDVGVMTSACGITYYSANLFPEKYRRAVFVAEGAHNIVHAATLRDHGVTFRASRMFDDREFLASTDSWFRPVNFYIGPDGALYVVDYYRKLFEHPEWMDDATAKSGDLYAGSDRGRIYRIVPRGTARPSWMGRVGLGAASTVELVRRLSDPNIWWRRHAQRLLVDRQDAAAAAALEHVVIEGTSPVGRVHALWTLQGLGGVTVGMLERALRDPVAGVRENAVRLAHPIWMFDSTGRAREALRSVERDTDPKVMFQFLLTLGYLGPDTRVTRHRLLFEHVEDEWVQIAALSAERLNAEDFFRDAVNTVTDRDTPGRRALFTRLGAMVAAGDAVAATRSLVAESLRSADAASQWWRSATLDGVASGLRPDARRSAAFDDERRVLAASVSRGASAPLRRSALRLLEVLGLGSGQEVVLSDALRTARSAIAGVEERVDAIRLLALGSGAKDAAAFTAILSEADPAPVQVAAVRALSDAVGDASASTFVGLWDRWTPAVRDEAVRSMTRTPARARVLIDAVAAGTVRATEIDRPLRIRLMMLADDELRGRARQLFAESPAASKDALARFARAADLRGDRARGQAVFTRVCSTCHLYRGSGGSAYGPDLGEVRNRLPLSLMTDIIDPNHSIADGYELWTVELADGTTAAGIVGAETPTSITFRAPGGAETTIPRERIKSMRIADLSAMPEGLASQIDVQQMADLIAFIKGG